MRRVGKWRNVNRKPGIGVGPPHICCSQSHLSFPYHLPPIPNQFPFPLFLHPFYLFLIFFPPNPTHLSVCLIINAGPIISYNINITKNHYSLVYSDRNNYHNWKTNISYRPTLHNKKQGEVLVPLLTHNQLNPLSAHYPLPQPAALLLEFIGIQSQGGEKTVSVEPY